jgi:predicted GNAT family N-acyltransferase
MDIVKLSSLEEHNKALYETLIQKINVSMKQRCFELYKQELKKSDDIINRYIITNIYVIYATKNNELIGYFSISRYDLTRNNIFLQFLSLLISHLIKRVFIYDVFIFPTQRNQGHGAFMIKHAINISKHVYKSKIIQLHITDIKLAKFYEKNDFVVSKPDNSYTLMTYYKTI